MIDDACKGIKADAAFADACVAILVTSQGIEAVVQMDGLQAGKADALVKAGEYAIELSASSQDELLAGAMTSSWQSGSTVAGLTIDVAASAKTFTRATGDFTTAVEVGDLVRFPGLAGGNALPFIVT